MALSKALVQPFRKNMLLVGAGYRAFFAPYNIALGSAQASTALGPTILDLNTLGPFNTNNMPAGWSDLGWIKDFKITPASKIGQVRSGYRGAVRAQYRGQVGESFEFKFRESSRMAFKIATGTDPFNLLATSISTTVGPLSATGAPTVGMTSYAVVGGVATLTASAAPSGANIVVGSYIVCDIDYDLVSYGLIGEAGVPIFNGAVADVDYIRRTSDFVARVTAINGNAMTLDQPFIGGGSGTSANPNLNTTQGTPPAGSKIQVIRGWAAREGGTFITEWSGLFLMDTIDQAQIALYVPHVSISQFRDIGAWAIENAGTTDLTGYELDCVMEALAFDDPLDGETVCAYNAYYAKPGQNIGY
jgi:hypothetical protein